MNHDNTRFSVFFADNKLPGLHKNMLFTVAFVTNPTRQKQRYCETKQNHTWKIFVSVLIN